MTMPAAIATAVATSLKIVRQGNHVVRGVGARDLMPSFIFLDFTAERHDVPLECPGRSRFHATRRLTMKRKIYKANRQGPARHLLAGAAAESRQCGRVLPALPFLCFGCRLPILRPVSAS